MKKILDSDSVMVSKCLRCSSLWAIHNSTIDSSTPWSDSWIPEEFLNALGRRRRIQARLIIKRFPQLSKGPLLDYGSGQCLFLERAMRSNPETWGCDLEFPSIPSAVSKERCIRLTEPWEFPHEVDWNTVTLLDVLEHHPNPLVFIRSIRSQSILIKVPLASGPLAQVAILLARFGYEQLLKALFLVGDAVPHQVILTSKGLKQFMIKDGWELQSSLTIPDVGSELPGRLRLNKQTTRPMTARLQKICGFLISLIGNLWSDTKVFYFQKRIEI